MRAYDNAKTELNNLRKLHAASRFAFEQTEEVLRYRTKHKKSIDPNFLILKPPPKFKQKKSFGLTMMGQLRELVFIRLISVLEAYLVDSVRDVFFLNKQPFKDQDVQVSFTQAEILSSNSMSYVLSKIINKECRRLTSGGFTEIAKYYRSHFNIDLYTVPPGKFVMNEYHERRHLFVHRLGNPDNKYRQTYGFSGTQLVVDETYLTACLDHFQSFIEVIHQHLKCIVDSKDSANSSSTRTYVKYLVILRKDGTSDLSLLNEDFHFWVGDEIYALRDILREKKFNSDQDCELHIAGIPEVLIAYDKLLKRAQKHGRYLVSVQDKYGLFKHKPNQNIDTTQLELIRKTLPQQPWPTGIHKLIAQQLGMSNSQISYAIQLLISQGAFLPQRNGNILG